ncbi:hypothetical protein BGW42_004925 [Actinomortierella wolfii]|nr:hypothetical protein BGW42_004925 [Actinomortierella wolfii]
MDGVSYYTSRTSEGHGHWDHAKDSLEHYDFVICGGGTAGCVLARRLAENPDYKILVLEAGYSDNVPSSKIPSAYMMKMETYSDWAFKTVPQKHCAGRIMDQPRGKLLGGTSAVNAMMYHRGPPSDYDEWGRFGNEGWNYQECLRTFNDPDLPASHPRGPMTSRIRKPQFETHDPEYHGTEGPWQVTFHHLFDTSARFIEANIEEGIPFNKDFNGTSTIGTNRIQTFIQRDAVRSSTARAYLGEKGIVPGGDKNKRGTIRVVYGVDIQRVLIQMRRGVKMATGVEFLDHKKILRRVAAVKEVLLCGGAFGSPHILLASGVAPAPQPGIPHVHTLPGVGQNLADHLGLSIIFKAPKRAHTLQKEMTAFMSAFFNYYVHGKGPLSSQGGEAVNFVRLEDVVPDFVAREKAAGTWQDRSSGPESPHLEIIFAPAYSRKHSKILAPDGDNYYMMIALLLNPCSTGTVTLDTSSKPYKTVVDPNYFSDSFDCRVMAESVKFMRRLGRRMSLYKDCAGIEVFPGEKDVPDHDDAALQRFARECVETYYHPTTTCKMGPASDPMAVVDARLNVYGIDRLRVIDASIFPKLPAAHTCAPTIMVAEKAADMIKEDWQNPVMAEPVPLARL